LGFEEKQNGEREPPVFELTGKRLRREIPTMNAISRVSASLFALEASAGTVHYCPSIVFDSGTARG
jgi:hypothetical protein